MTTNKQQKREQRQRDKDARRQRRLARERERQRPMRAELPYDKISQETKRFDVRERVRHSVPLDLSEAVLTLALRSYKGKT
jgi:hypothetical protein